MAVETVTFTPPAERRSALDRAHLGDVEGALGTIGAADTAPRRAARRRVTTFLAVLGPGLIVTMANNDAGGFAVFAQAGQNYGLTLLWVLWILGAVLLVNQEMVARLGAVTGVGHARLILERFGRRWGAIAVGDLLALNLATLVTEFIGVTLGLGYFGVPSYVSVPSAAIMLLAVTASGRFRRWERVMFALVAFNVIAVPLALLAHPSAGAVGQELLPNDRNDFDANAILLILALVGTAPWALFFQQSNVVDKRITPRWMTYERLDVVLGSLLVVVLGGAIWVATATAFAHSPQHGHFANAGRVAHQLQGRLGSPAGSLFALGLVNASLLGAATVTLASSYALGEVFGLKHSLHRGWRDARAFHASFTTMVVIAAAVVLVPHAPLGLITIAVQGLAGVLLPSATIFLLLLCNDSAVLGPWTNPRWLNVAASVVVAGLIALSGTLIAATSLPQLGRSTLAMAGVCIFAGALTTLVVVARGSRSTVASPGRTWTASERRSWTMPHLESLAGPLLDPWRTLGLVVLRVYLAVAVTLLVVRAVQIAGH